MSHQDQIRQKITDQVVAALRAGTRPWVRPWADLENTGHPTNVVSGRRYSGVNVLSLMLASQERSYNSKFWATFNQWHSLGFQVRKRPVSVPEGQWGVRAVLFKPVAKVKQNPNGEDEEERFLVMRDFYLFNAEQASGPGIEQYHARPRSLTSFKSCERADHVIFGTGAHIRHGGGKAVYHAVEDYIEIPPRSAFRQAHEYYGVAAHELCHWTGHEGRLARLNKLARFGDESYAMEELVAEMGAAFLKAEIGVPDADDLRNVSAYLADWLKVLESDYTAIFTASSAASRAVDYILAFTETQADAKGEQEGAESRIMIRFYRETSGDYLAIDTTTNRYYLQFAKDHFEGRASAIEGLLGSVCTTGISRDYLKANCKRVPKSMVPAEWLRAIGR